MNFFATEFTAFTTCFAKRRLDDPSALLSLTRPIQVVADVCFCSKSNAFMAALLLSIFIAVLCYTLSKLTRDDSWIDRGWSVFPVIYAWIYVCVPDTTTTTAAAAATAVPFTARKLFALTTTLWGIRMTYNFWRRGGYSGIGEGNEDYRWKVVRTFWWLQNRAVWELFSFGFISLFQSLLLFAQTLPILSLPANAAPEPVHYLLAAMFLVMLLMELLADEQQWVFQEGKYGKAPKLPHLAHDYKRGFLTNGLFAVSRHPNVFSEQSMWTIVYLVSVVQGWGFLNASIVGVASLIGLTIRSTFFTEEITSSKYKEYSKYQQMTPMLIPARGTGPRFFAKK